MGGNSRGWRRGGITDWKKGGKRRRGEGGRKRAHCGLGDHGLMGSWRKAYGALKDSTTVGLAKVNSEFKVSHGDGDPISVDSKLSSTDFCGF